MADSTFIPYPGPPGHLIPMWQHQQHHPPPGPSPPGPSPTPPSSAGTPPEPIMRPPGAIPFNRPNFGNIGRPIVLRANHFQVKIPSCVLDVAIVPDKCPRRVNREIAEALINAHADYFGHQKPVFDGRKNVYSRRPLPIGRDRVEIHVNLPGGDSRDRQFKHGTEVGHLVSWKDLPRLRGGTQDAARDGAPGSGRGCEVTGVCLQVCRDTQHPQTLWILPGAGP